MYHQIQVEDETHSKKSASSTIKSRLRVKSVSKYDQFIRITHFLLAIKSGLGVKSGWRLDKLFTLGLLFTSCLILCLNFMVHIQNTVYYFSANKKYPLFSISHLNPASLI